jgi:cytochrome P450
MDVATFDPTTLFQPAMFANPYPVYAKLRPHTPIRLDAEGQVLYPFMKYRHVYGALRDHETYSSVGGVGLVLIGDDPPRHTQLRRIVNKVFTPRRVAEAEPWIQAIADQLFTEMIVGEIDVVDHYTMPLPVKVIAKLLGIPGDDYRQFKEWSDSFIGQDGASNGESMMAMTQYFAAMAAHRRTDPGDDLITALVNAEVEGEKLSEWELLGFCVLLLVAGNETTTNLMSKHVEHPCRQARPLGAPES